MRRGLLVLALVVSACSAAAGNVAETTLTTLPSMVTSTTQPPASMAGEAATTTSSPGPATLDIATTTTTPPPATNGWYLIWVPVMLPEGFTAGIEAIDGVGAVSLVRSGNGFLVETHDAQGELVDRAPGGYVYPVEVNAYDDAGLHARFVPEEIASRFAALRDDTVMLGTTSARLRGLTPGGTLTFESGVTVTVAGVIDDAYVGDAEVVTARTDAEVFGDVRDRYLIVEFDGDPHILATAAEALTDERVVVRPWRVPRVARAGDQVRSQVAFKERFGEFAIRLAGGDFIQDPAWRAEHIITTRIPLLGTVTCHRDFVLMLTEAMTWLDDNGYGDAIDARAFRGCHNARFIAGRTDLSHHSWGAAADINFFNPPGEPGSPTHPALLQAMYAVGLTSGHAWNNPDPGHFEWIEDPPVSSE